jgi:pyruvate carboxylase
MSKNYHIRYWKYIGDLVKIQTIRRSLSFFALLAFGLFAGVFGAHALGVKDYPKTLPPELVAKINAALNKTIESPDVIERFAQVGAESTPGTPERFANMVA